MRIGLQAWGTEGDLRPFLALSQALKRNGHDVRLAFTGIEGKDFTSLIESAGVETQLVDDGYFRDNRETLARRASEGLKLGSPSKQFEMILSGLMDPVVDSMLDAARALASDCDVVVGHFLAHTAAAAAEERARPYVMLALQPVFASAHYPPSGAPALGRLLNPLLWKLANHIMRAALESRVNATRARCGLQPIRRFMPAELGSPRSVLVAVSPSLFPRPSDWSAHLDVCGSLALDEPAAKWIPEPRLQAFLDEGAPVYLSFGSMFGMDERLAAESVAVFAAALTLAGKRGIVQAPLSVIASAPRQDNVCYIERAPHAEWFPRCSAIVHHGGAGTTQSALLAGRGSVIVPHGADQFYWGDLLYARGVAAKPLKRPALTASALATRLRAVLGDTSMAARAAELSTAMRAERGSERAAETIARCLGPSG